MLKLEINSVNNEFIMIHDMHCKEHMADELAIIIDELIADYEVKSNHKYDNCTLEEKNKIIIEKRNELLQMISLQECSCKNT